MIRSMTGFGESEVELPTGRLRVELRTVNHRYLNVNARLPNALARWEPEIREWLRAHFVRGHVNCTVRFERNETGPGSLGIRLDVERAANYVALGHIHKPQPVAGQPDNKVRYSGSPLQLDFGEVGDTKHALLVEAQPGKPSTVTPLPVSAGRRLFRVELTEEQLDAQFDELTEIDGWLKLVIKLERMKPGLKERLQQNLPNLLTVEQLMPGETSEELEHVDLRALSLVDSYRTYLEVEKGMEDPSELVGLFQALHDEVSA